MLPKLPAKQIENSAGSQGFPPGAAKFHLSPAAILFGPGSGAAPEKGRSPRVCGPGMRWCGLMIMVRDLSFRHRRWARTGFSMQEMRCSLPYAGYGCGEPDADRINANLQEVDHNVEENDHPL